LSNGGGNQAAMMNRRELARAGICAGMTATIGIPVSANPATSRGLRRLLDAAVTSGNAPGYSALVDSRSGKWTYSTGYRDLEARTPMRRDTIFRVASLTKPVVAAAAMMLVDEGRIRLKDPIDRWIPELANRRVVRSLESELDDTVTAARRITVRDLLTLQLGIGALFDAPSDSPLQRTLTSLEIAPGPSAFPGTEVEFLRRLSSLPLAYQPGERWLYHTGMEVAGILISRVSRQPLSHFIEERMFRPLGMSDTSFWVAGAKSSRLATSYHFAADGRLAKLDQALDGPGTVPPNMESGGGGLFSTVDDFGRFGRMLLDGGEFAGRKILSRKSVRAMCSDQISDEVKQASRFIPGFWKAYGWGLGMAVSVKADSTSGPGRFGWWGGTGTTFFADPSHSTVAVLMSQRMMTRPDDTEASDAFLKIAFAR
jgi:CubicO group peptidase (beta-lactamase class C family)